jgi:hypothetical protein
LAIWSSLRRVPFGVTVWTHTNDCIIPRHRPSGRRRRQRQQQQQQQQQQQKLLLLHGRRRQQSTAERWMRVKHASSMAFGLRSRLTP